jgi:predicted nucleic acid binding AN1-type Zn finger protein
LEVCHHCGKELEDVERYPDCGLTFCEEHLPTENHCCLVRDQERNERAEKIYLDLEIIILAVVAGFIYYLVNFTLF